MADSLENFLFHDREGLPNLNQEEVGIASLVRDGKRQVRGKERT